MQQRADVKPPSKKVVIAKRWAIPLILIVVVAVGIGITLFSQQDEEGPPQVKVERPRPEEKPPEDTQRKNAEAERQTKKALREKQIVSLLKAAEDKLRTRNLTIPRSGEARAALDDYRAVLALDPDNEKARAGVRQIAEYFAGKAEEAINDKQWDPAEEFLDKAADIDARLPALAALRERFTEARRAKAVEQAIPEQPFKAGDGFRDKLKSGGEGPAMVVVPAGEFLMGSTKETDGDERGDDERQHLVAIAKPFAIGQYEITLGEFGRFIKETDYKTTAEATGEGCYGWDGAKGEWVQDKKFNWKNVGFTQNDKHPVVCVSWHDAIAYAEWMSRETGEHYRLPTEAEWEYAARAGTSSRRYWGNDNKHKDACRYANVADASAKEKYSGWAFHDCQDGYLYTAPVGKFIQNKFGLYDILGNVWEWTCSNYDKDYGGAEKECTDKQADSGRSLRGGSWYNLPWRLRSANRDWDWPTLRYNYVVGFRLARTL